MLDRDEIAKARVRRRALTELLREAKRPLTFDQLAARLGVDRKTVQRDLHFLSKSGVPVVTVRGRTGGALLRRSERDHLPQRRGTVREVALVGRTGALNRLRDAAEEARQGILTTALVHGEPGIGKSRLLAEASVLLASAGFVTVRGRCTEVGQDVPLSPWVEMLESMADRGGAPAPLGAVGDPPPLPEADLSAERGRAFHSVASYLGDAAAERPLGVILDDFHRADSASAELLEYLATRLDGTPVLFVLGYRDAPREMRETARRVTDRLSRMSGVVRLRLNRLSAGEIRELVTRLTGRKTPESFSVQALHERTRGNPLFITELAKSDGGLADLEQIPPSVLSVITDRMDGLSVRCNRLLRAAALLGRVFDPGVAAGAAGIARASLVAESLSEAEREGLVEPDPSSAGSYRFSHLMVRDAIVAGMTAVAQAELHLTLARTIESIHGGRISLWANSLAYHFGRAAPVEDRANHLEYVVLAAESALRRFGWVEARDLFVEAREISLAPGPGGETVERHEVMGRIYRGLGLAYYSLGDAGLCMENLLAAFDHLVAAGKDEEAVALSYVPVAGSTSANPARSIGRSVEQLTRKALAHAPAGSLARGRVLSRMAWSRTGVGDIEEVESLLSASAEIAIRHGDFTLAMWADGRMAMGYMLLCEIQHAIEYGERALEYVGKVDDPHALCHCHYWLSTALFHAGAIADAIPHARESYRAAELSRNHQRRRMATRGLMRSALLDGDWDWLREIDAAAADLDVNERARKATMCVALLAVGEDEEASALLSSAAGDLRSERSVGRGGQEVSWPALFAAADGLDVPFLDDAERIVERFDQARPEHRRPPDLGAIGAKALLALARRDEAGVAKLRERIERYQDVVFSGDIAWPDTWVPPFSVQRVTARLSAALGLREEATNQFEKAVADCGRPGARAEAVRTAVDFSEFLAGSRSRAQRFRSREVAKAGLVRALDIGMRPAARRLEAVLQQLDSRPDYPAGLSAREVEVVRLLCRGLNNRQIATRLVVAESTVAGHVRSILQKTGAMNRTEAAGFATRAGLVDADTGLLVTFHQG